MSACEEAATAQPQKPEEQQQQAEENQTAEPKKEETPAKEEQKPAEETPAAEPAAPQQPEVTYRSLVLNSHGGYDKVKLQNKKGTPKPKAGQVLVRVKACGLNFADLMARQGVYDRLPSLPFSLGLECSGIVEELGEEVTDRKVGDRVMVFSGKFGLWQELVTVQSNLTFLMPEEMTFEEGAALLVNYLTAHMVLFNFGNLKPRQSVLVHMAAGGVGTAAVQLCKTVEDVTIFGTASASKHEALKESGVTHPIDYRTSDYVDEVRKISPKGVNIVMDPLGGSDTSKGFNLLKPMGKLVIYGSANLVTGPKRNVMALAKTWWHQFNISALQILTTNKAVCGYHLSFMDNEPELLSEVVAELVRLYKEGKIKPKIDSKYPFEQVGDAMRQMQDKKNVGKVILVTEVPKEEVKKEEK